MKTNAGPLNLVTLTRSVSGSGLDEMPAAMVEEMHASDFHSAN